ncbi:hypothetical protein Skr01_04520 [Sphaerisporangium krabiense]|uniref:Sensor domain-containing protein n=1 Tax=Sphaerisporangium krabiense TaxID=763782 RepID=A0A7W9DRQ4_9ACTN|nr:hypothetical protein [Sphaerisporangium krabiense]MBB5628791.1 hypothetical protein [Sphaerisporangium krabiense]GII60367.1 hypothetical protein Skr01_04520 [Sphaerisporangium krabiense]
MRGTGVLLACALIVGATAACGAGGLFGGYRAREELSRARQALNAVDDPSSGFTDRAATAWQRPFRPASEQCGKLFDLAEGRHEDGRGAAEAVTFRGDLLGETAGVVLSSYAPGGARDALRDVGGLMRDCRVASVRTAGAGDRLVGSPLPLRALGDGVEARRYKGRVGGYPYEMHLVVVRSGGVLISLVHTGLAKLDPARTERLAAALATKVGQAAE